MKPYELILSLKLLIYKDKKIFKTNLKHFFFFHKKYLTTLYTIRSNKVSFYKFLYIFFELFSRHFNLLTVF